MDTTRRNVPDAAGRSAPDAATPATARRRIPGKPVWFEHASAAPAEAQAFFEAVLGWQTLPFGDSGYDMIQTGDAPETMIGGYTLPTPDRSDARWLAYVSVEDVDAAAGAARAQGGAVLEPPHDLPGVGRVARIADPQGAELCLFRRDAGDPEDPPLTEPPPARSLFWIELHTTEPEAAVRFYEVVVGYTHEPRDMGPGGAYHILEAGGVGRGGVTGHLPEGRPHWLLYAAVEDPDATLSRVEALGGQVLMGPEDIPGVGRFGVLADPFGAPLAVMKALPPTGDHA